VASREGANLATLGEIDRPIGERYPGYGVFEAFRILEARAQRGSVSFEHGNVIGLLPKSSIVLQQSPDRRRFAETCRGCVEGLTRAGGSGALRSNAIAGSSPSSLGRKAVHRFAALIIALAVAITPAQAQRASELRISGTVEKLDGNRVSVSLSEGISLVVHLDSEPRVQGLR
jgi:hypothetical protein